MFDKLSTFVAIDTKAEGNNPRVEDFFKGLFGAEVDKDRGELAFLKKKIFEFFLEFEAFGVFDQSRVV